MKLIELTQGQFAKVDDADLIFLSQFSWCASKCDSGFYAVTSTSRKDGKKTTISMHRLLLDAQVGELVDHEDLEKLNNQRYNLRKCTRRQNICNSVSRVGSASKYKGVFRYKKTDRWVARIKHHYKGISLGVHDTQEDAARAYNKAAPIYHGEFARLNVIPETINL